MCAHAVTVNDVLDGHVALDIQSLDRIYLNLILSFRVSQGCDLRRPVVDGVADGTLAAWSLLFQRLGSLPDRIPADRWSPSARAS